MTILDKMLVVILAAGILSCIPRMFRWRDLDAITKFRVAIQATLWIPYFVVCILMLTQVVSIWFDLWWLVGVVVAVSMMVFGFAMLEYFVRCNSTSTGRFWRWVVFPFFRWRLMTIAPKHPLMAYPYAMFVDLELPQIFKDGGMKAAYESALTWGDRFSKRFDSALDNLYEYTMMKNHNEALDESENEDA